MAPHHHGIDYIEMPATDIESTKTFYAAAFGWSFRDWGPDYVSFTGSGIDGGFATEAAVTRPGVLVVLYSADLEATLETVVQAGGTVVTPTYSFPGGRRFHFTDPNGNELAVWGEDPDAI